MARHPRSKIIDEKQIGVYHVRARCVRRAFLCGFDQITGQSFEHRKKWCTDRIEFLASIFLIDVGSFAIMSNHVHFLLRNRPDLQKKISDHEVMERWWKIFPVKIGNQYYTNPPKKVREKLLAESDKVQERRERLSSISWFMRCFSQFISIKANREDQCTGAFWEGRFKATAVLDDWAVIRTSLYIDLNPVRANVVADPREYEHSSISLRAEYIDMGIDGKSWLAGCSDHDDDFPFLNIGESEYISMALEISDQEMEALSYQVQKSPTAFGKKGSVEKFSKDRGFHSLNCASVEK